MEPTMTGPEALEARNELGLSQRKVAQDAGVNRHILSQFEQGKIRPKDDFTGPLQDYFERQGFEFEADEEGPEGEGEAVKAGKPGRRMPKMPHPPRKAGQVFRDGFEVAPALPDDQVEDILDELDDLDRRMEKLRNEPAEPGGFLETSQEANQEKQDQLKAMMARSYCLVRKLHGHDVVEPCGNPKDAEPKDQEGLLSQFFGVFLPDDEKAGKGSGRPAA